MTQKIKLTPAQKRLIESMRNGAKVTCGIGDKSAKIDGKYLNIYTLLNLKCEHELIMWESCNGTTYNYCLTLLGKSIQL